MRFLKDLKNEEGQVMVLTLLSMTVLMGFMALAVDMGTLYNAQRRVQITADAAAMAATLSYHYTASTSTAAQAATNAAGNNGMSPYIASVNTTTVSANTACSDLTKNCLEVYFTTNIVNAYHTGPGYVEAIVSQPNPSYFMNTFSAMFGGSGFGNLPVSAKAVGGIVPSTSCTTVLDKTDADTLSVTGGGSITSATCGITVDSSSPDALCVKNGKKDAAGDKIDAPYINVVGGQQSSKGCKVNQSGSPVYGNAQYAPDPFGSIPGPNPLNAAVCTATNTFSGTSYTADPGKYVTVTTGSGALATTAQVECFTGTNVAISGTWGTSPSTNGDIFVFKNGVTINGTTTMNGTLDIYNGTFTQGVQNLTINAPGSDDQANSMTYNAIAIMQPASDTTGTCTDPSANNALQTGEPCLQLQFGSGNGTLNGYIYAPTSMVYLQDNGGSVGTAGIVAYTMYIRSALNITSYNETNGASTPLTTIQLVE